MKTILFIFSVSLFFGCSNSEGRAPSTDIKKETSSSSAAEDSAQKARTIERMKNKMM